MHSLSSVKRRTTRRKEGEVKEQDQEDASSFIVVWDAIGTSSSFAAPSLPVLGKDQIFSRYDLPILPQQQQETRQPPPLCISACTSTVSTSTSSPTSVPAPTTSTFTPTSTLLPPQAALLVKLSLDLTVLTPALDSVLEINPPKHIEYFFLQVMTHHSSLSTSSLDGDLDLVARSPLVSFHSKVETKRIHRPAAHASFPPVPLYISTPLQENPYCNKTNKRNVTLSSMEQTIFIKLYQLKENSRQQQHSSTASLSHLDSRHELGYVKTTLRQLFFLQQRQQQPKVLDLVTTYFNNSTLSSWKPPSQQDAHRVALQLRDLEANIQTFQDQTPQYHGKHNSSSSRGGIVPQERFVMADLVEKSGTNDNSTQQPQAAAAAATTAGGNDSSNNKKSDENSGSNGNNDKNNDDNNRQGDNQEGRDNSQKEGSTGGDGDENRAADMDDDDDQDNDDDGVEVASLWLKIEDLKNVDGAFGQESSGRLRKNSVLSRMNRFLGATDSFFEVKDKSDHLVARSQVLLKNLSPVFPPVHIAIPSSRNDATQRGKYHVVGLDESIYLTFYDWEENKKHQYMGRIKTTLRQLKRDARDRRAHDLQVDHKPYGKLHVRQVSWGPSRRKVPTGTDFIFCDKNGLTDVGVDDDDEEQEVDIYKQAKKEQGSDIDHNPASEELEKEIPSARDPSKKDSVNVVVVHDESDPDFSTCDSDDESSIQESGTYDSLLGSDQSSNEDNDEGGVDISFETANHELLSSEAGEKEATNAVVVETGTIMNESARTKKATEQERGLRESVVAPDNFALPVVNRSDINVAALMLRITDLKNVDGIFGQEDKKVIRNSVLAKVKSFFGASDPFFEVLNKSDELIARSPVMMENLNPIFPPVFVPVNDLSKNNAATAAILNETMYLTFYDWEEDGKHQFLGHIKTSLGELKQLAESKSILPLVVDRKMYGNLHVENVVLTMGKDPIQPPKEYHLTKATDQKEDNDGARLLSASLNVSNKIFDWHKKHGASFESIESVADSSQDDSPSPQPAENNNNGDVENEENEPKDKSVKAIESQDQAGDEIQEDGARGLDVAAAATSADVDTTGKAQVESREADTAATSALEDDKIENAGLNPTEVSTTDDTVTVTEKDQEPQTASRGISTEQDEGEVTATKHLSLEEDAQPNDPIQGEQHDIDPAATSATKQSDAAQPQESEAMDQHGQATPSDSGSTNTVLSLSMRAKLGKSGSNNRMKRLVGKVFGSSASFFEVRRGDTSESVMLASSNVAKSSLRPAFMRATIPMKELGGEDTPLVISFFSGDNDGQRELVGEAKTSARELCEKAKIYQNKSKKTRSESAFDLNKTTNNDSQTGKVYVCVAKYLPASFDMDSTNGMSGEDDSGVVLTLSTDDGDEDVIEGVVREVPIEEEETKRELNLVTRDDDDLQHGGTDVERNLDQSAGQDSAAIHARSIAEVVTLGDSKATQTGIAVVESQKMENETAAGEPQSREIATSASQAIQKEAANEKESSTGAKSGDDDVTPSTRAVATGLDDKKITNDMVATTNVVQDKTTSAEQRDTSSLATEKIIPPSTNAKESLASHEGQTKSRGLLGLGEFEPSSVRDDSLATEKIIPPSTNAKESPASHEGQTKSRGLLGFEPSSVRDDSSQHQRGAFLLTLRACLKNVDGVLGDMGTPFGASDSFFEISRQGNEGPVLIACSSIKKNDRTPTFEPIRLSIEKACNGNLDAPISISFYDWESSGEHKPMGTITTCMRELMTKADNYKMDKKGHEKPSYELQQDGIGMGDVFVCDGKLLSDSRGYTSASRGLKVGIAGATERPQSATEAKAISQTLKKDASSGNKADTRTISIPPKSPPKNKVVGKETSSKSVGDKITPETEIAIGNPTSVNLKSLGRSALGSPFNTAMATPPLGISRSSSNTVNKGGNKRSLSAERITSRGTVATEKLAASGDYSNVVKATRSSIGRDSPFAERMATGPFSAAMDTIPLTPFNSMQISHGSKDQEDEDRLIDVLTRHSEMLEDAGTCVVSLQISDMQNLDEMFDHDEDSVFDNTLLDPFMKPFFEVLNDSIKLIARSDVMMNKAKNPVFPSVYIPFKHPSRHGGTRFDHVDGIDSKIYLTFFNWKSSGRHEFLGHFCTSLRGLEDDAGRDSARELRVGNKRFGFLHVKGVLFTTGAKVGKDFRFNRTAASEDEDQVITSRTAATFPNENSKHYYRDSEGSTHGSSFSGLDQSSRSLDMDELLPDSEPQGGMSIDEKVFLILIFLFLFAMFLGGFVLLVVAPPE